MAKLKSKLQKEFRDAIVVFSTEIGKAFKKNSKTDYNQFFSSNKSPKKSPNRLNIYQQHHT
eukprot:10253640-Ditylum_brightwellii.AAC.1